MTINPSSTICIDTDMSYHQTVLNIMKNESQEKILRRKKIVRTDQKNCFHLTVTVILMIIIAIAFVATRVALKGPPVNKIKSPPYRNLNISEMDKFDYVMDWYVDFPEARPAERRVPPVRSHWLNNLF